MNRELWIAGISEESPCGDDLEYDADFMALDQSTQGKPEQQYGDTIIPAEEPDWRDVERLGSALLERTKDIRVCVPLTRACTRNEGLPGLAVGLQTIQILLEKYWAQVHPRLIVDGEDDPFVRINAIAALNDASGLLRDIRQAALLKSPAGPILIKDAEAALDKGQGAEAAFSRDQLVAICSDPQVASQPGMVALAEANDAIRKINQLCDEQLGAGQAPNLTALSKLLSSLVKALITEPANAGGQTDAADTASSNAEIVPQQRNTGVTDIRSREDAIRVLDLVCRYIEKNEPTNPAPLLIKRAQRLMSLSFVEIIKDMAPDGLNQIETITGIRRE